MIMCVKEEEEDKEGTCRADFRTRQGANKDLVPLVELSAELLKGSAKAKRSGSSREVSGDFSPSISFSVASQREKMRYKQMAKERKSQSGVLHII